MLDISCPLKTPLFCICSKKRKKKSPHFARHISEDFCFSKVPDSELSARQCSNLRRTFSRHRNRNRQIKHARCFFNELKFVSRDSGLFRRLLSIEFSFAFSSFFPPFHTSTLFVLSLSLSLSLYLSSSSACTAARIIETIVTARERERERERENSITPISCLM